MKKITIISLAMVLMVGLYIGANSNKSESSKKPNNLSKNKNTQKTISPVLSGYKKELDPLKVSPPYVKKSSIAEAEKKLPFKVKLPSINLGAKTIGVYNYEDSQEPQDRRFQAIYDNGLKVLITNTPDLPPMGQRKEIAKFPELAGFYSDRPDYFKVQVNGKEAFAREPGDYVDKGFEATGGGRVTWRVSLPNGEDIDYSVYHAELSVKELIKIAESIPFN